MEISIIIPTHNRASLLLPTLRCLKNQHFDANQFEVVLVDTGNDSETPDIVQQLKIGWENLHYQRRTGTFNRSEIRNTGAELSKGQILLFLDNDILTAPDFLARHVYAHEKSGMKVVMALKENLIDFDSTNFSEAMLTQTFGLLRKLPAIGDERNYILKKYRKKIQDIPACWRLLHSHNFSLSKKLFFDISGFDDDLGKNWGLEDVDLGLRLYLAGAFFEIMEGPTVLHQPHPRNHREMSRAFHENSKIFVRKNPSFETELFSLSWYIDEEFFENILLELQGYKKTKNIAVSHFEVPGNGISLGNLQSMDEAANGKVLDKRGFLGLSLPFVRDQEFDWVSIGAEALLFSERIWTLMFREASRIGRRILFVGYDGKQLARLKQMLICLKIPVAELLSDKSGQWCVLDSKVLKKRPRLRFVIPNAPNQRDSFIHLALELSECGIGISIIERPLRKAKKLDRGLSGIKKKRYDSMVINGSSLPADVEIIEGDKASHSIFPKERQYVWAGAMELGPNMLPIEGDRWYYQGYKRFMLRNEKMAKKFKNFAEGFNFTYLSQGYDPFLFKPTPARKRKEFTFFCPAAVSNFHREGLDGLLDAFTLEFNAKDPVELVIKLTDESSDILPKNSKVNAAQKFNHIRTIRQPGKEVLRQTISKIEKIKSQRGISIPKIKVLAANMTLSEYRNFYQEMDCLVRIPAVPYGLEGSWLEVLSMGKKIIAFKSDFPADIVRNCSGIYCPDEQAVPCCKLVDDYIRFAGVVYHWRHAQIKSLQNVLRKAFKSQQMPLDQANGNYAFLSRRYSWKAVSDKLVDALGRDYPVA